MNIVLAHWSANWPVLIIYLAVALAHLTVALAHLVGARGVSDRRRLLREAVAFHAGLLVIVAALLSPLAYWSGIYLWVQAIQALALSFVAPPLIVLGAPWLARMASPASRGWPVLATVLFNVTWLGWHLPFMSDLAHTSGAAGIARIVTCLGTGMLFWLQLIGSRPPRPTAAPLRRVALVIGTIIAGTLLGMVLVFGSSELYPAYGGTAHHVLTMLDDQQLAGAVLWMGMLPPMIITAVALLQRWLSDEESQALSAGIEGLLRQRKSAWPSRPGFR